MENDSTQNQVNNQSNDGIALNSLKNKLGTFLRAGNGRFILGGAVIILVILISVFAFSKKTQVTPQKVSPNAKDALLVTVGDQKIYKSDVQKAAKEQYVSSAIDNKVLQVFLDLLIEQKILDLEANKLGITVSREEINANVYKKQASGSANTKSLDEFVKYQILKEKIMAKDVKSVSAYVISFWIPPLDYPQRPEYPQKRIDGERALVETELKLKAGDDPLNIAKSIHDKYPSLKEILGLNGIILDKVKYSDNYLKPKIFTFNKVDIEKLGDPDLYNTLESLKPGEIKKFLRSDNSGGGIIKAVEVNNSSFSNYNEFLNDRKKELVKTYSSL